MKASPRPSMAWKKGRSSRLYPELQSMWKVVSGNVPVTMRSISRSQPRATFSLTRGKPASTAFWMFPRSMS